MKLREYKNREALLDMMFDYGEFMLPSELEVLHEIDPKSRIILTDKALVCYSGKVIRTFSARQYIMVQILIDLNGGYSEPDPPRAS